MLWLLLAPTKTDHQLVFEGPLAFGSLNNIAPDMVPPLHFPEPRAVDMVGELGALHRGGVTLAVVCAVPAGYGLALTQFIGRRALLSITLIVMIMPASALVIPLFLEMNSLRLLGTAFSVILPFAFFPFGVYLSYIFFSSNIPRDLLAAARVDGCTEWNVFRRIALPLAKPIVALIVFFAFVADWTNFFLPYVMFVNDRQYPVSVGLQYLLQSTPSFNPTLGGTDLKSCDRSWRSRRSWRSPRSSSSSSSPSGRWSPARWRARRRSDRCLGNRADA